MIMISLLETEKNQQHLHAHNLLRECLKAYGKEYKGEAELSIGEHGKPYLTAHPEIHFNLSHSSGIAVCLTAEHPCGVDCEKVRNYRENVVKRAFSAEEQAQIEAAAPSERDLLFFRLWTLKEAYVKAIGIGISYPLNEVSFRLDGNSIECSITGCRFRQYILRGGVYVVSSCILDENKKGGQL